MRRRAVLLVVVVMVAALLMVASPAWAKTITVNTTEDELNSDGDCSLREAMEAAKAHAGPVDACPSGSGDDTIVFGVSGTITLGSTLPPKTGIDKLTVDGEGQDITISGDDKFRVLQMGGVPGEEAGGTLIVRNVTVANGFVDGIRDGGGVQTFAGSLTVENSTFVGNRVVSGTGGALSMQSGTLMVKDSTFVGNSSEGSSGGAVKGANTVEGSTFSGNSAVSGGAISGANTVEGSTFSENTAWLGGAIAGAGLVTNSTFSGNSAVSGDGGAIYNQSGDLMTVAGSTFSENSAGSRGGGIFGFTTKVSVENSTFSGNSASTGGGIFKSRHRGIVLPGDEDKNLRVTNSTFSGNTARVRGGGISNMEGIVTLTNSTLSKNGAGEGGSIFNEEGNVARLRATIVADSPQGGNCAGTIRDKSYNIDDGKTCGFRRANGSKPKTDPGLDPNGLQNNGGPTKTIALQPGSPAIDAITQGTCPPPLTDQRGVPRPQDGDEDGSALCDIGAFELEGLESPTHADAP